MTMCILVVDDESDIEILFRRRFRREVRRGEVIFHFAASGEDAIEALEAEIEPELMLILSDINMPGMNGLELLGRVKDMRPTLPVVMITAYGDDERRKAALELGASDFLAKPIDFSALKAKLPLLVDGGGG